MTHHQRLGHNSQIIYGRQKTKTFFNKDFDSLFIKTKIHTIFMCNFACEI